MSVCAQVVLFCTTCSFGTSVAVASFPTDLSPHKRFTLFPSVVTAISVWFAVYMEYVLTNP